MGQGPAILYSHLDWCGGKPQQIYTIKDYH